MLAFLFQIPSVFPVRLQSFRFIHITHLADTISSLSPPKKKETFGGIYCNILHLKNRGICNLSIQNSLFSQNLQISLIGIFFSHLMQGINSLFQINSTLFERTVSREIYHEEYLHAMVDGAGGWWDPVNRCRPYDPHPPGTGSL